MNVSAKVPPKAAVKPTGVKTGLAGKAGANLSAAKASQAKSSGIKSNGKPTAPPPNAKSNGKVTARAAATPVTKPATKPAIKPAIKPVLPKKSPPPKKKGPIDLSTAKSVAAVAVTTQADASGYVLVNGRRVRMISTRGLPSPKRAKASIEKEVDKPELQVSSIKTKLNKKELDEYRALLLVKRRQLIGMLSGMEDEALRSNGGNLSTMPLHMADIGTDTFDQDFTLGMAETERALLDEIDAALGRIDQKTYGVCQLTGKPIPKTRLEAKPWAKHTIESAKLVERGVAPR